MLSTESSMLETSGPVTTFGHAFSDIIERTRVFKDELRRSISDLSCLDGFPCGSADDIVNLSHPPYYTACPNPWIKRFIEQWEKDKDDLERSGYRSKDKLVTSPYSSDVSEGKNNPIYMAHAYHTKVPHLAIMKYILHYTQPGDIIFDGFAGTGMTGVAANLCASEPDVKAVGGTRKDVGARKCICSDLSPIATLISASYNLKYDAKAFERAANEILKIADETCGWMYKTNSHGHSVNVNYTVWSDVFICPNCHEEVVFWKEAVDLNAEIIRDVFYCPHCGAQLSKKNLAKAWETYYDPLLDSTVKKTKKVPVLVNYTDLDGKRKEKPVDDTDLALIRKASDIGGCKYLGHIPDGDESSRNFALGINHIHQLFTPRNLNYLNCVHNLVKENPILHAWFTSVIQNASIMYKFRLDRKGGLVSGTLFVPSLNIEQNPSRLLKSKIKDFALAAYSFKDNTVVNLASATNLSHMPNSCIDYIFVDPPFGSNLMYSELNSIWEGWLGVLTNNKEEAIVNNSQNKSIFEYQTLMNRSLSEFYRILKPGKWLTLEFSNTSASVWNSIQNALQGVGFVIANVAALDKQQGSFKAVTTTTAVKQDLVITCYKPTSSLENKILSNSTSENVWDFIDDYLHHIPVHLERNNLTTVIIERNPKILFDRLITYYVQKGLPVPIDASDFQLGLRERYLERDGMFFTPAQAAEYDEKRKLSPELLRLALIISSESDGIEWLRNRLQSKPQTYQDIQPEWMQAINGVRKNDIIPELKQLLDENFIQDPDGKWRCPNIQDDKDVNMLRTKSLLREFAIYVEAADKPKAKIKEARVEALRAGFKDCYIHKDFATIVKVGNKIPQNLLTEDEVLLQFYDIASNKI